MKISARQYAQGLYDSVLDKSEPQIKAALKNFTAVLAKNLDFNKVKEIIERFEEIWETAHGEVKAELLSARELGPTARETVVGYLKEKTGAKKISMTEEIDHKLLGGFVLKYNSKVLDGSLKTSLEELKNEIGG
jgi:F-type H+-transporting ATPase subunit delta